MEYQSTMLELVKVLLKILALGLPAAWDHPPDVFDEFAVNPSMPMRLLHYAPQPIRDDSQFGGDYPCIYVIPLPFFILAKKRIT